MMQPEIARSPRSRIGVLVALGVLAAALALVAIAGLGSSPARTQPAGAAAHGSLSSLRAVSLAPPALVVKAPHGRSSQWRVVASIGGAPAAWLAQQPNVTLMRFDQSLVRLDLHAGSHDGGSKGWTYGNRIASAEAKKLIAGFNGGFKLTYKETGFMENGHVGAPLRYGLASIVTYADGTTNIGAWHEGVPSGTSPVFSVLQNQRLLVDHGVAAANVSTCVISCWGGTIGLVSVVPRSAIGITAGGDLVWVAGEHLSPEALAQTLISAGVQRAVELDINPWWVAGYLYLHHHTRPKPVPLVKGQRGIEGFLLTPYSRDFIAITAK